MAAESVVDKCADLNIFVNNAGYGPTTSLQDITSELFDKINHIYVVGTF